MQQRRREEEGSGTTDALLGLQKAPGDARVEETRDGGEVRKEASGQGPGDAPASVKGRSAQAPLRGEGFRTTPCKECGREMIWGVTEDGKKLPLDARRVPAYDFEIYEGQVCVEKIATVYVSHFLTCPKAENFSASRRKL